MAGGGDLAGHLCPRWRSAAEAEGSCGIFQAHAAYQAAAEIEKLGNNAEFGSVSSALESLMAELNAIRPQLENFMTVESR